MMELEICVDSLESAIAAEQGGAQRIELCSALREGGITPSAGLVRAVRTRVGLGLYVMIRPRSGDFVYSNEEFGVMRDDIALAAEFGADGVVFGILTAQGDVDIARTRELVELARPMKVTFHRAIDMSRDLVAAVNDVVEAGVDRVLTSGGAPSAMQGLDQIAAMVDVSAGRVEIMVGGGVRPDNVQQIARATRADAFHSALRTAVPSPVTHRNASVFLGQVGLDEYVRHVVLAKSVKNLRHAMEELMERKRG
jgi:copper homeostasis protein